MTTENEKITYNPYKAVRALVCFFIFLTVILSFLIYCRYAKTKKVDISEIPLASDEYVSSIEKISIESDGTLRITGYAFKENESIESVNVSVVVEDLSSGSTYSLTTGIVERTDITKIIDDGSDYNYSGFQAVTKKQSLSGKYHVYIIYKNNGDNVLIDTSTEFDTAEI
ncbi:MAG: hypothetical protein K6F37_02505 [Lachnospiraceae bacterium]|nr:hypothetical protein [Lachnospiraceae bacterium]